MEEEIPFYDKGIFGIFSKGKKEYPLIVLVHGWAGNHLGTWNRFFVTAARYFSSRGFNVVRFDFRGSGNSIGNFENQTITSMIEDLTHIISFSKKNFEFNGEFVLIGHSRGFYVSLFTSRLVKSEALVSWMGRVSDLRDFWPKIRFEEFERRGFLEHGDFTISKKYVEDSLKYNSTEVIKKLKIPALLIYGENDKIVPPSEGVKFQKFYRGNRVKLKILKGLNHDFYGKKAKSEVLNITYRWLKETLKV